MNVTRKLIDSTKTVLLATLTLALLGACAESTANKRAFIIEESTASPFLGLISRTAALVGRHVLVLDGIEKNRSITCPSDASSGITVVASGFTLADGDTGYSQTESYNCPLVKGTIEATYNSSADKAAYTLVMKDYSEGATALGTSQVNFQKDVAGVYSTIAVQVAANQVSYQEDQMISATLVDGTVINLDAVGSFTVSVTVDALAFSGSVTYEVEGIGTVLAQISNMKFDTTGACAGSPNSGEISVEIAGLEKGIVRFTACNSYNLINLDQADKEVNSTTIASANVKGIYETGAADFLSLASVADNFDIQSGAPYADDATFTATAAVTGTTDTYCRLLGTGDSTVVAPAASAADLATYQEAPQAECLTFAPSATISPLAAFKVVIASHVAFTGPLSDATKAVLLSAAIGMPVTSADNDAATADLNFNMQAKADTAVYSTQAELETGLGAYALNAGPNPFTIPVGAAPVQTVWEWSRPGLWLTTTVAPRSPGLYLPVH